jgi:hypothetical protein
MVMKPAEQPSRKNRSFKSGRVPIKQGGELDHGGAAHQDKNLRAENSRTGFWNADMRAEIIPD